MNKVIIDDNEYELINSKMIVPETIITADDIILIHKGETYFGSVKRHEIPAPTWKATWLEYKTIEGYSVKATLKATDKYGIEGYRGTVINTYTLKQLLEAGWKISTVQYGNYIYEVGQYTAIGVIDRFDVATNKDGIINHESSGLMVLTDQGHYFINSLDS